MQYILPTGRRLAFAAALFADRAAPRTAATARDPRDRKHATPARSPDRETRGDVAAWARHAGAANGFGDAATEATPSESDAAARISCAECAASVPVVRRSRRPQWTRGIVARIRALDRALFRLLVRSLAATLSRWHERRQRHRHVRDICIALGGLDAHTLRDLGFHPSEIPSIAAEMTGGADVTRVRSGATTGESSPHSVSPIVATSPSFQGELRHAT